MVCITTNSSSTCTSFTIATTTMSIELSPCFLQRESCSPCFGVWPPHPGCSNPRMSKPPRIRSHMRPQDSSLMVTSPRNHIQCFTHTHLHQHYTTLHTVITMTSLQVQKPEKGISQNTDKFSRLHFILRSKIFANRLRRWPMTPCHVPNKITN